MDQITAILERVVYSSMAKNFPGSVFAVLAFSGPAGEFKARGEVPADLLGPSPEGGEYRLQGEWTDHPRYGRQLAIASMAPAATSERGVAKYLTRFEGIGPATARRVVETLGAECLDRLAAEPALLDTIPDLTNNQREAILGAVEVWRAASVLERAVPWLMRHGLGPKQAQRAAAAFGEDPRAVLEADPWLLSDLDGFGFLTADKFAKSLGVDPRAPARVRAAVRHVLAEAAGQGHVFLPLDELATQTAAVLRKSGPVDATPVPTAAHKAVEALVREGRVVSDAEKVYLPHLHRAEEAVAQWFTTRRHCGVEVMGAGAHTNV